MPAQLLAVAAMVVAAAGAVAWIFQTAAQLLLEIAAAQHLSAKSRLHASARQQLVQLCAPLPKQASAHYVAYIAIENRHKGCRL